jgi:hypothetical protein
MSRGYVVYQIMHNTLSHCYIGVTRNYDARCSLHRHNLIHSNTPLYETMRENGGIDSYRFMVIEKLDCDNRRDAERLESEWIQRLEGQNIRLLNKNKVGMNDSKLRNTRNALSYYYRNRADILKKMRDRRNGINPLLQIHATETQDNAITEINTPL